MRRSVAVVAGWSSVGGRGSRSRLSSNALTATSRLDPDSEASESTSRLDRDANALWTAFGSTNLVTRLYPLRTQAVRRVAYRILFWLVRSLRAVMEAEPSGDGSAKPASEMCGEMRAPHTATKYSNVGSPTRSSAIMCRITSHDRTTPSAASPPPVRHEGVPGLQFGSRRGE